MTAPALSTVPAAPVHFLVTSEALRRAGACSPQRHLFREHYPNGCEVTAAAIEHALALGLDVWWAIYALLPASARAAYDSATAPARAAYDSAFASARAAYGSATASARADYNSAIASALAAYESACASALAPICDRVAAGEFA